MFTIKESRSIEPSTFAHLVSSTLYSRRFGPYFTEPVLAGLAAGKFDIAARFFERIAKTYRRERWGTMLQVCTAPGGRRVKCEDFIGNASTWYALLPLCLFGR